MHVVILTLCPEIFSILHTSILGNGIQNNIWKLDIVNIRNFANDLRKTVDDQCVGGGPGMLIKPDITHKAIKNALKMIDQNNELGRYLNKIDYYEKQMQSIDHTESIDKMQKKISNIITKHIKNHAELIYFSPRGSLLTQQMLYKKYQKCKNKSMILLCGRYEGVDQRIIDYWQFNEISIGDYILTNGDIAALAFLDSYLRFIPGILGNYTSIEEESFKNHLLESNNYTKPIIWNGISVPDVLRSGNHALIKNWKLSQSKELTSFKRPDLWLKHLQSQEEIDG